MTRHRIMRDSDTYWAIIEEGEVIQAKEDIWRLGKQRFGPADESVIARLDGIADLQLLERMHGRLLDATGWQDLLDTP